MKKHPRILDAAKLEHGERLTTFQHNYLTALKAKGCEATIVRFYGEPAHQVEVSNDADRSIASKR